MKSRILVLISLAMFAFALAVKSGTIEKKFSMEDYTLKRSSEYTLVSFGQAFLSGKAGEPTLPYLPINLLLPAGQKALSIEFSGEELTEIPGTFILYPYQYSKPISEGDKAENNSLLINHKIYRKNISYPGTQTGHLTTQYLHGYPIATATFTPVVYNPLQKKLWYYKKVTIKILTGNDDKVTAHMTVSSASTAKQQVKNLIQNPETLPLFPPASSDPSDYKLLIIAPEIFNGHFTSLIDHYFIRGIKTKVITTASIYSTYSGIDNQEKIRNCIINEYQNNHIEQVLLAGDIELIPARGFWAQVQSSSVYTDYNIPADLYYSALDGNWNTNGDDKWAEPDEDDLYPELSVGRFTVSTLDELDNLVNKTIHYQNVPVVADNRKPLLVGEKLWDNPLTWGGDYLDLLIGEHSDNGYTTNGIPSWHNIQKLYDRDLPSPWTLSDLLTHINAGASFLHQVGHANTTYVMRMYNSSVFNSNFSQVNGIDHNFIPIYSHGCYCAAFDYNDCIAEKMVNLNTFAVAFVGNSRYGWFNEGTTEGPSEHLHREFINALYHEGIGQIGSAHTLSKINTAVWVNAPGQWEEGALRWCFYTCNVLGDPAMFVWTDNPLNLTVTHEDTISAGTSSLSVYCDTLTSPVKGLTCTLIKDSVFIGTAVTDSTGFAQIPVSLLASDTGILTVIVSGYNCLSDTSYVHVISMASVNGIVSYDNTNHTPLDSLIVYLMQQGDTIAQAPADSLGHYLFQNVTAGMYEIKISCSHSWGGANSSDALQIMRHFVHINLLTGLALKASDIDHNNITNSLDAFGVQKRFVGTLSYFPAGDWIFENKSVNVGLTGETIVNIHGLCIGDVNKSFTP